MAGLAPAADSVRSRRTVETAQPPVESTERGSHDGRNIRRSLLVLHSSMFEDTRCALTASVWNTPQTQEELGSESPSCLSYCRGRFRRRVRAPCLRTLRSMSTFTVISTVFGLVMTAFGIWLTIRANHNATSAPFDERQAALRTELRARLNSQFRLVRAVDNVDRGLLPGSPVEADLDELRTYLNAKTHRFVAPTPEQIEVVIKSIDSALAALAVAHHPPRNDTAFIPHVDEIKSNVLRPWLVKALADINVLLDGLAAIERQPMSVRRQIKLFAALNPENQTPIEV